MISNQILQTTVEGLKAISRIDFCVIDSDGKISAKTFEDVQDCIADALAFMDSPAESQVINGYQFFKVYDESDVGRDVGSFLFKDEYDSVADLVADLKNTENSLKKAAERVCPEITEVIKAIEEKNSLFTTMSGSGATCFGLFPNRFLLSEAAGEIRRRYPKWWVCETEIV